LGSRLDALPGHRCLTLAPPRSRKRARRSFFEDMPMTTHQTDHTALTRRLNDMARSQPEIANASWVMTRGVAALLISDDGNGKVQPDTTRLSTLRATLARFNDWPEGNDPYSEHDFGAFDLFDERLFFKIDYYHPDHDTHAPVPSCVELCRRVLTIMLSDEY
jgi:hypothetical protein